MSVRKLFSPPPQIIEAIGLSLLLIIICTTVFVIANLPAEGHNRSEILRICEVGFSALGATALFFLWAQLRHAGTLNKLVAYHEYFHDLPKAERVSKLYATLHRLRIEVPLWQAPMTEADKNKIVNDNAAAPDTADIVVREYLNDFEEFAAAVNSGLVDEDYAYHLESARPLNAYFGFREIIDHWLAEDLRKASRLRESGITPSDYYGELRKLAERWRVRKLRETSARNTHGGVDTVL